MFNSTRSFLFRTTLLKNKATSYQDTIFTAKYPMAWHTHGPKLDASDLKLMCLRALSKLFLLLSPAGRTSTQAS